MKPIEAKEAFVRTIEDITSEITKRDLYVNIDCYFSDRELEKIDDENADSALVLSAVITVSQIGVDDTLVFEHAIVIDGGEVLNDEIIKEATKLRASTKELCDKIDSGMSAKDTICSMDIEPPVVEEKPSFNNKIYYIGGAIAVAVIILLIAFLK